MEGRASGQGSCVILARYTSDDTVGSVRSGRGDLVSYTRDDGFRSQRGLEQAPPSLSGRLRADVVSRIHVRWYINSAVEDKPI
jgi:hypothetical protein